MATRKGKCPGCNELKANHSFGTPGKNCEGWQPSNADKPKSTDLAILEAIKNLSQQFQRMEVEHNELKEQVKEVKVKDENPCSKPSLPPALSLPGTSNELDITGDPTPTMAAHGNNLTDKLSKGINDGEYVDFADILTSNMAQQSPSLQSNIGIYETTSGETVNILKPHRKRTIDNFDTWLQAWNCYEQQIMTTNPRRYFELARYRENIQMANRKFRWANVYMFDIQSRMKAATRRQNPQLHILDTTLYTTMLDASALRPHPRQCSRCKSFDHLVRDCAFLETETLEEVKSQQKATTKGKPTGNQSTSHTQWKFDKWFSSTGKEGCNLYQRNLCTHGANCKRAHICKACRGEHTQADCPSFSG